VRESPALDASELLRQKGADVRYHDPYVPSMRHNGLEMTGEPDPDAALRLRSGQGIGRGGLRGGGDEKVLAYQAALPACAHGTVML
jgi:hypothetical protein